MCMLNNLFIASTFNELSAAYHFYVHVVHNRVLWFIFVIVVFVFYVFFKILKEFRWGVFNKRVGLGRYYLTNKIIFSIESLILSIFQERIQTLLNFYYMFTIEIYKNVFSFVFKDTKKAYLWNSSIKSVYLTMLNHIGLSFFKGFKWVFSSKTAEKIVLEEAVREKYVSNILFSIPSRAYFYTDTLYKSNFLKVQSFKHSTILEFIYALIPIFVISTILVPSIALLYGSEEDIDPYFTYKVIGHQWYWSYDLIMKFRLVIKLNVYLLILIVIC